MKRITFTSISDVFSNNELTDIKAYAKDKLEKHACHGNATLMGLFIKQHHDGDYTIKVCQGYFYKRKLNMEHSFNKVEYADGRSYYVDFTAELVNNEDPNYFTTWSDLEMDPDYVADIFDYEGASFPLLTGGWSKVDNRWTWYDNKLNKHSCESEDEFYAHMGTKAK